MNSSYTIDEIRALDAALVENKPNVIFVYTPPKVGSSTLVSTLKYALFNTHAVVHIHDNIMLHVLTGNKFNPAITVNDLIKFNACILRRNVYVINIYRPLLERKISEYFEHIATLHFNTEEANIAKYKPDLLISRFNKLFPHIETVGDHYLDVYDIAPELKIRAFDMDNRYIHHRVLTTFGDATANINYVVLRLMDANTHWVLILGKIFGNPGRFTLLKENVREEGAMHDVYKKFKEIYKLPQSYKMYLNTPATAFYEPGEKEETPIHEPGADDCECVPFTVAEYNLYLQIALENSLTYGVTKKNYKQYKERMTETARKARALIKTEPPCAVRRRVRVCGMSVRNVVLEVSCTSRKVNDRNWGDLSLYK